MIAEFRHDDVRLLAGELREWLSRRNVQVVQPTLWEQGHSALGFESSTGAELALTIEQYRKAYHQGYLLCGEVREWTTFPPSSAHLEAQVELINLESGETVYDRCIRVPDVTRRELANEDRPLDAITLAEFGTWRSVIWGAVAWATGLFVAPWLLGGLLVPLLAKESNAINAALLAALVLSAAGVAWVCFGRQLGGDTGLIAALVAGGLSIPYLGYACGHLHALRE